MDHNNNPWRKLSAQLIYDNPWIQVEEHQVLNPSGKPGIYGKVHFKNNAIGIVPLDNQGNTWLVGQFRYTLNEWSWEIPEGGGPLAVDHLTSAKRELEEETGLRARQWTAIGKVHLSNSVSDESGYLFIAEELEEGAIKRDDTEADMQVRKIHFSKVLEMVMNGEITDSLSVIAILKVAQLRSF